MRHVRRLIVMLAGCATWFIASAAVAVAVAQAAPEPPLVGDQWWNGTSSTVTTNVSGTPLWQTLAIVALGVLLAVAVGGLFYSLEHRRSERSRSSRGVQA